ncbi:urease accessory protein UreD [Paenibacillus aurantius]|uniref:Urease accessory protein UreD n=1 Tax=Paenibacillus aurantius TaxID=2918900 RepID=A0AA96L9I9_9BACL|nr:urease accessory protein UreD [Paenibacillus aurantius]WNQ09516.1 urease accessory protein UreD [Paenibacillus aurantius]
MPSLTGCLSAVFCHMEGQTRLAGKHHQYPLKIAKPFPLEDGQLGVYVMDASPGILAGDRYVMDWRVGEGAQVLITNQSYTKVHPARKSPNEEALPSSQIQTFALGRNSCVEYMPEPLMLYGDAVFESRTEVTMEEGAVLLFSDVVTPGRTLRGEVFRFEKYRSSFSVNYAGELIYSSRQQLEPGRRRADRLGSWGRYTHTGSLYVFSDRVDASFVEGLRQALEHGADTLRIEVPPEEDVPRPLDYGISQTYKHGLVLSAMGSRSYEIQGLLDLAWGFVRRELLGRPPLTIRK